MNDRTLAFVGSSLTILQVIAAQFRHMLRQRRLVEEWQRRGVEVSERAIIRLGSTSRIEIGEGSSIAEYSVLDLTNDPNGETTVSPVQSTLIIGRRTAINEFNNVRAAGGTIRIGDNCLISQYVSLIASNHAIDVDGVMRDVPWSRNRNWVVIGDDVWIGTHSIILPGVTVGSHSVIAAGSVVTGDVPEGAVVAGVPASVKRFRTSVPAPVSNDRLS